MLCISLALVGIAGLTSSMDWAPYYIGAYLAGSIPFGLLVARAMGVNIREVGSGNIGATNVGRALGRKAAALVFALDFLKGLAPTWLAAIHAGPGPYPWEVAIVGMLAILGHNFPVWLKFNGGKGVATTAGVLAAILPITALVGITLWAIVYFSTRYVSIASLAAAVSLPITTWFVRPELPCMVLTIAMMVLGTFRHRSNIAGLIAGTENRFDQKKGKPSEV